MLVLSQVILSMQLGFAVIPLLHYVSSRQRMGEFAIGPWTKAGGWISAGIIIALNIRLVVQQVQDWFTAAGDQAWLVQWTVIPVLGLVGGLLAYIALRPLVARNERVVAKVPHGAFKGIAALPPPEYNEIAVALDFSEADQQALRHALQVGGRDAKYFLFHVVESAGAWVMGDDIQDYETAADREYLEQYAAEIRLLGYSCEAVIGYGRASKAIPLLVEEKGVDLLVMGAHGHQTIKDLIFGETIRSVQHAVQIPVLIVHQSAVR
jgi:manganese transport protein